MNVIALSFNYEKYITGNYHQDLINALERLSNVFLYGPGYKEYNIEDNIFDVIKKSGFDKIDLILVSTSWEIQDENIEEFDPHPKIDLGEITDIKKVFFLNKEYKKIGKKLEYIKKNKFDLVMTVLPEEKFSPWEKETGIKFKQSHFGIDTNKFRDMHLKRKYDFAFTGALHTKYTDERKKLKEIIFKDDVLTNKGIMRLLHPLTPISKPYRGYNIYWAEWGKMCRKFNGKSLLPTGDDYIRLMNQSKTFFCTLSANGIFGTRFFELMACRTLIICPEKNYYGLLSDGVNCVMYKNDLSDFAEKLYRAVRDTQYREKLVNNAFEDCKNHNYDNRLKVIFEYLKISL